MAFDPILAPAGLSGRVFRSPFPMPADYTIAPDHGPKTEEPERERRLTTRSADPRGVPAKLVSVTLRGNGTRAHLNPRRGIWNYAVYKAVLPANGLHNDQSRGAGVSRWRATFLARSGRGGSAMPACGVATLCSCPAYLPASSRRSTLPTVDRGRSDRNSMTVGTL